MARSVMTIPRAAEIHIAVHQSANVSVHLRHQPMMVETAAASTTATRPTVDAIRTVFSMGQASPTVRAMLATSRIMSRAHQSITALPTMAVAHSGVCSIGLEHRTAIALLDIR